MEQEAAHQPMGQTQIQDEDENVLARYDFPFWPAIGALVELEPPDSAIVTQVRLRLHPSAPLILVDVKRSPLAQN